MSSRRCRAATFLRAGGAALAASAWPIDAFAQHGSSASRSPTSPPRPGSSSATTAATYGGKLLPETMGSGCAFIDYDADGWPDILLVNGMDWPGHKRQRSTLAPLPQQSQRHVHRRHARGRPRRRDVRHGRGRRRLQQRRLSPTSSSRASARTGCSATPARARSSTRRRRAASADAPGFSTSALWFDYDRDGLLDLFVCNYVKWTPEHDVFCSLDGKQKSYCTPEAYRGDTCWLFRNRGNGTFEDVTATCGIFDTSSKSLGVTMIDSDIDGWPDLFVANDTQPNKLYRNLRNGTFKDVAVEAGLAFSADGKARAGMGADAADFDNSGAPGLAVTNFDNEMIGLYRPHGRGLFEDVALKAGVGAPSRNSLGFGCAFADFDLDGDLDLVVANGHIDETVRNIRGNVGYAQPPHLFLNQGNGTFRDAAADAGREFAQPRVGRGLACGDFDRDGDVDLLVTTNNGPAVLFRNDQAAGNRFVRFHLTGTTSNRDAIGATVRIFHGGTSQSRLVKSGSSYLSQSELPVTFGVGTRDRIDRVVVSWPNGRTEEFRNVATGKAYDCVEGKGMLPS